MLQVLYTESPRDLELSGTRLGLLMLGRLLRGRSGNCDLSENRQPAPYERSLAQIFFREDSGSDTVSILTEGQVLQIRGGRVPLDLLAGNIEGFASESEPSDHLHLDFPAHDYISPESDPLVVAFLA